MKNPKFSSQGGFALAFILIIVLILITAIAGFDIAFIKFTEYCGDVSIADCLGSKPENSEEGKTTIVANGSYSYKGYGVTISLTIPLEGGRISGAFKGDCSGKISGTYNGGGGGAVRGKANGSCGIFLPASASFTGNVFQKQKTVPLSGTASIPGFSQSGSITLTY